VTALWERFLCWLGLRRSRLDEVASLPANWDSYGSVPPTADAVESARFVLEQLDRDHHISPVSGGGIQIDLRIGNTDVEINIDSEGKIEVWSDECR